MSLIGGEKGAVQNPLIRYAAEIGWTYIGPEDALALRGGKTGIVFRDTFISQLQGLNDFLTQSLAEELIRKIEAIPPNIEGNLTAWEYLKGVKTVFVQAEKRERNVRFLDTSNPAATNTFHVTDEFTFTNGKQTIRADVACFVNGIPVFIAETKAAHKTDGIAEALDQIRRYHNEAPEIMAVLQLYSLTHIIRYYYGATWNTSRKGLLNWKDEQQGDFEALVKTFFDKERIIKVLDAFILFTRQDDELKKVVLRPHQMRAVRRIVERARSDKKRGLIWHTQGSGKTYTMIVAAREIIANPLFDNPTVIMLVDRNELEGQLFGNLAAVGVKNVDVADGKKTLQGLLRSDKRGLIISMIHKFDGIAADINTRENIFVLIDEAHRTTGGKLGNYLMGALPNATYIGFTGTPIDRTTHGSGTFIVFGQDDPPKGYLDKYGIAESIEDNTTVPLHYALAPNDLQVDKEVLNKEFLELAATEGISDIEELNKVLEEAVNLRNMLKNRPRMEQIALHIADHFRDYVEPMGYKAFIVAVDREACTIYKDLLDRHLSPECSRVIISPGGNDSPQLARHHLSDEEEKRIRKAFRRPDTPIKILIVTEKLLTGFDAPVLYCMYLDKPMRDHVLLQAIARVNRPYEDANDRPKPSGFVLDFVGIFGNLEKALAFDSSDIEGVVHDIEVLKERFKDLIEQARSDYLVLIKDKSQDKAVEAILNHFMDEEERHRYYSFFKEISIIYEILSPDAFLRPYLDDLENLARFYKILKEAYEPGIAIDREFSRKTERLVQGHTKSGVIKPGLDIYEINGETLKKIDESKVSDIEKVINIRKSIAKIIIDESGKSPYLVSIGEKAEEIAKSFTERQLETQKALEELKRIVEEINQARKEQAEKNISPEIFTLAWLFKKEGIANPYDNANEMKEVFDKYPHWKSSERHESEIRKQLYKILVRLGVENYIDIVTKIMTILTGRVK
ncbi:type I restriction-modification system subunit R [Candidatus Magnetobacterium bavaricum]|uniref:Type I restriction enzyme endonuclease subunit n=1 Tax=Candidatus Magnetobacterium bavaricum TaxID=29290 RepID=A0A0F3GSE6_9BACT|nr:type I restriction-modification system subunit R [Candidatus Magnetobacterium bavaricum]